MIEKIILFSFLSVNTAGSRRLPGKGEAGQAERGSAWPAHLAVVDCRRENKPDITAYLVCRVNLPGVISLASPPSGALIT